MTAESIVAIDGPSASGKTSAARMLASRLGYRYLDTGALYRAAALKIYSRNIPLDREHIKKALENSLSICEEKGEQKVLVDGEDVTEEIRKHQVSRWASDLSAVPEVREILVDIQRRIAGIEGCVVEGRDIGTVVFPNAKYKFYLDASLDERARRRQIELNEKGAGISFESIRADIRSRDKQDATRSLSPLKKAEDAVPIDTTGLTLEAVVEKMLSYLDICNDNKL